MRKNLLTLRREGIYCPQGNFYIDPHRAVDYAVVTHAHSDHAHRGMKHYLVQEQTLPIVQSRLGKKISIQGLAYRESIDINGVQVKFYPAGHIRGSAQVSVTFEGETWVASGDYKTSPDLTCEAFEPVPCHAFITESTFAMPIFNWQEDDIIFDQINQWWFKNKEAGIHSVIYCYSLGKAQRLLSRLNQDIGEIYVHDTIAEMNACCKATGLYLPEVHMFRKNRAPKEKGAMILTAPSPDSLKILAAMQPYVTAQASGWMALPSRRKQGGSDAAFVLSDHADWKGLHQAIEATGAEKIIVTHGYTREFVAHLNNKGYQAMELSDLSE
jgi:putative mRNA 3-end processing factor